MPPDKELRLKGPTPPRRSAALPSGRQVWWRAYCPIAFGVLLSCAQAEGAADELPQQLDTATPIGHLVIIFQENTSFDSYFGVYPVALNPPGEPAFEPRPGTPSVNGLTETLLPTTRTPRTRSGSGASTATPAIRTTTMRPSREPATAA